MQVKVFNRKTAGQKLLLRLRFQNPGSVTVFANLTQTHGKIWIAAQDIEKSLSKERLGCFGIVDRAVANGRVRLPIVRSSVVVEGAIQELKIIRNLVHLVQLVQVTSNQLVH